MRATIILTILLAAPAYAETPFPPDLVAELGPGMAAEIRRPGYACPRVHSITQVGYDHLGHHLRVACGGRNGADPRLVFRVTTNGESGRVQPWR
jgi:hypothetical protein